MNRQMVAMGGLVFILFIIDLIAELASKIYSEFNFLGCSS